MRGICIYKEENKRNIAATSLHSAFYFFLHFIYLYVRFFFFFAFIYLVPLFASILFLYSLHFICNHWNRQARLYARGSITEIYIFFFFPFFRRPKMRDEIAGAENMLHTINSASLLSFFFSLPFSLFHFLCLGYVDIYIKYIYAVVSTCSFPSQLHVFKVYPPFVPLSTYTL